ncbi:hypothetical protein M4D79_13960 [Mycolicibacterium novocastrense]|nr:hypothetical protein M4D79_13960 [Mycolicibacterium novocastrense]
MEGPLDPEARARTRYLDLWRSALESRALITARSSVLRAVRETLFAKGFVEVETPILQQLHGGATARPFVTHINTYSMDLFLRIAPELYLKRLCVGGVERVFELGRAFRNEGVDFSHNPEFTLLEAYQAHADCLEGLTARREPIQNAAQAATALHRHAAPDGQGFRRHLATTSDRSTSPGCGRCGTVHDAISEALGERIDADTGLTTLRKLCDAAGVPIGPNGMPARSCSSHAEHLVECRTEQPTFYIDFPTSVSPLTRPHRSKRGVAERWDLVAWGIELGTAYSELTDPWSNGAACRSSPLLAAGETPRRWNSTKTSCKRWSTPCRPPAARAWALTGRSC